MKREATLTYTGLVLLSAATLAFEIALTRLFSVTQWYHFAFLAVSVALLGYGASGTALSLFPRWVQPPTSHRAPILSFFFAASVIIAYLSLNYLPFDSYRIAWERIQVLYLVTYYLALTIPFFFAGLVTGMLLAAYPQRASQVYASNLFGSAIGCLVPVVALASLGEGVVLLFAALGLLAALLFLLASGKTTSFLLPAALLLIACCVPLVQAWQLPPALQLRISPYKGLSQVLQFPDAVTTWQRWNAFSRVDRVASSAIRSAPGLSLEYPGELPQQDGLFTDGDDLSPLVLTEEVESFTGHLPVALPYQLRAGARALVLNPRGGLDIKAALSQGAASVVAVESNRLMVEAAAEAYQDKRISLVIDEGRSYARHSMEHFDIVHLSLGDGYRPVTSGAYSLGERYDLTVEAFEDYIARLSPGGLIVVQRWLQMPPSETVRAGATIIEAMRRIGIEEPAARLAVLRDWQVGLILVKNGDWSRQEIEAIRAFSRDRGLDLVALPGLTEAEANRFNVLDEPLYFRAFYQLLSEPEVLYDEAAYDVRPPTDDRPFFFHFFKWGQTRAILGQLGKTWQPWGGSGYFVLLALLAVAIVASVALILFPLAFGGGRGTEMAGPRARVFLYFSLLGLGFLFAEIPLLQRFILFLGQPIYAFATVVASLLMFSSLGSLAAPRIPLRYALPCLPVAILLYPLILPVLFDSLLGQPLALRLLTAVLSLAPLGFLLGIPFAGGIVWLRQRAPGLIPWAWAINGCASVLASILAATIALSAGFASVLAAAAVAYALAWPTLR